MTRPTALAAPVVVGMMFKSSSTAAVEIFVQRVEGRLIAGIGVDRVDEAGATADRVMQHMDDGCEAVGR